MKATKMGVGQGVGINKDSPDGNRGRTENYRLLYYPNREYKDLDGGQLFFYSVNDPPSVLDGIRPVFNSGVLMSLSERSYHSVCEVKEGVRYTVAVLYWGYPILSHVPSETAAVARCLKDMIEAGLEGVRFGNTTLAYHFYHTYRLLTEWNTPISTRLAGLMQWAWRQSSRYPE